jgi:GNAT superfamily N-acetyltransferase
MEYVKIVSDDNVDILVSMANEIWSKHFTTMFDSKTLSSLIEGAQSRRTILSQLQDGYQYFFIEHHGKRIGYFAYNMDLSKQELFLSKLYIYTDKRGKGIGKKVLNYLEKFCQSVGLNKITLTVYHKNIDSIRAYEKWGFTNLGLVRREFDNGLVFEDIQMEKHV